MAPTTNDYVEDFSPPGYGLELRNAINHRKSAKNIQERLTRITKDDSSFGGKDENG